MERHITVLQQDAIKHLALNANSIVVDATLGAGGHAREILKFLKTDGIFIGFDVDASAISAVKTEFSQSKAAVHLVQNNFRYIEKELDVLDVSEVSAVLADLGWRIEQFLDSGKGFSFRVDEPLLMTLGDPSDYPFTASDIANEWEEEQIAIIIKSYGEERYARRIARGIVSARSEAPIATSKDLARVVSSSVPSHYRKGKLHPATKTFQAFRIAVNDELEALSEFLEGAQRRLMTGGRIAVITFHSLEDRIVKRAFRSFEEEGSGVRITKRPLSPTREEVKNNPRARSAKLRIFEKTDGNTNKRTTISKSTTTSNNFIRDAL